MKKICTEAAMTFILVIFFLLPVVITARQKESEIYLAFLVLVSSIVLFFIYAKLYPPNDRDASE